MTRRYISPAIFKNRIEKEFEKTIGIFTNIFPENVYHYTDSNGILGMLSGNSIRATNIYYLNDYSEAKYSMEIICETAKRFQAKECSGNHILNEFIDDIVFSHSFNANVASYYVSCFCSRDDLLSQWRAYGDGGLGYSLGLYTDKINLNVEINSGKAALRRVVYKELEQTDTVNKILSLACSWHSECGKEGMGTASLIDIVSRSLLQCLCLFKHPTFEEESEWRLLYITDSINHERIMLRSSKIGLIPYVELSPDELSIYSLSRLPVASIMHGPSINPELARKSIEILRDKYCTDGLQIKGSRAPLRA